MLGKLIALGLIVHALRPASSPPAPPRAPGSVPVKGERDPRITEIPRWLRQWLNAVRQNLKDPELIALARGTGSPAQRTGAAALFVRQTLPYRFEKTAPILDLRSAKRRGPRGRGACGEGTAACAAVALLAGARSVRLCYETVPGDRGYAHVRLVVDGIGADAYPDASWSVEACSASPDVRELLGWRAAARA